MLLYPLLPYISNHILLFTLKNSEKNDIWDETDYSRKELLLKMGTPISNVKPARAEIYPLFKPRPLQQHTKLPHYIAYHPRLC